MGNEALFPQSTCVNNQIELADDDDDILLLEAPQVCLLSLCSLLNCNIVRFR